MAGGRLWAERTCCRKPAACCWLSLADCIVSDAMSRTEPAASWTDWVHCPACACTNQEATSDGQIPPLEQGRRPPPPTSPSPRAFPDWNIWLLDIVLASSCRSRHPVHQRIVKGE
ncbi:hypothetical protein MUK42_08290 [Musa troglodytarum]|uniref:Uncharacterized protein n=1 Tax=Musa troglodytarum TaxID=320322 RepID=A0A9E7J9Q6_9LILI|nr:hypothetical protein MUK42_08290 [Musa troglodytarum]